MVQTLQIFNRLVLHEVSFFVNRYINLKTNWLMANIITRIFWPADKDRDGLGTQLPTAEREIAETHCSDGICDRLQAIPRAKMSGDALSSEMKRWRREKGPAVESPRSGVEVGGCVSPAAVRLGAGPLIERIAGFDRCGGNRSSCPVS